MWLFCVCMCANCVAKYVYDLYLCVCVFCICVCVCVFCISVCVFAWEWYRWLTLANAAWPGVNISNIFLLSSHFWINFFARADAYIKIELHRLQLASINLSRNPHHHMLGKFPLKWLILITSYYYFCSLSSNPVFHLLQEQYRSFSFQNTWCLYTAQPVLVGINEDWAVSKVKCMSIQPTGTWLHD